MNLFTWNNKTPRHPNGVREAAVALWLRLIHHSSAKESTQLLPETCNTLQAQVAAGLDLTVWEQFRKVVGTGPYDPSLKNNIILKSGSLNWKMNSLALHKLLAGMEYQDFWYISAKSTQLNPLSTHAFGLYKAKEAIYFFDPDQGIYTANAEDLTTLTHMIESSSEKWSEVVTVEGNLRAQNETIISPDNPTLNAQQLIAYAL